MIEHGYPWHWLPAPWGPLRALSWIMGMLYGGDDLKMWISTWS